jgi:hypothetical protein
MKIVLDYAQQIRAAEVALSRIKELDLKPNHSSRYDKELSFPEYVAQVTESIGAEIAVAKYFGMIGFDPAMSRFKLTADVGAAIEVKWTHYDGGSLIIYESDRNHDVAVLVVGKCPKYRIAGWIPVSIAKRDRYKHHKQPTWWIGQQNLQPIENLYRSKYGEAVSGKVSNL